MRVSKSIVTMGSLAAAIAAGSLVASAASAQPAPGAETVSKTYVVCNRYDECWRVHQRYTTYPADEQIVIHDSDWYDAHQHDTHWHWLNDPADDHGWYDKDGSWHRFHDDNR